MDERVRGVLRPVALLGLPYDAASSFARGAADAPRAIRAALGSTHWNLTSETGVNLGAPGLLRDLGDVALGDDGAAARLAIERGVGEALAGGPALSLGGDHSVTYPAVRAAAARAGAALTLVHVDAHTDLYEDYEGDRFSHACPFARIMEEGLVRRLLQVGVRTLTPHQRAQAERWGVELLEMRDWTGALPDATLRSIAGPVYLSIDVDALDPAFAPGVSHREPGGLTVRELLRLVQTLPGELVAADLVEYNPDRDVAGLTGTVCGKLAKEMLARLASARVPA